MPSPEKLEQQSEQSFSKIVPSPKEDDNAPVNTAAAIVNEEKKEKSEVSAFDGTSGYQHSNLKLVGNYANINVDIKQEGDYTFTLT